MLGEGVHQLRPNDLRSLCRLMLNRTNLPRNNGLLLLLLADQLCYLLRVRCQRSAPYQ